jgi:putative thiamine transport system permease protein
MELPGLATSVRLSLVTGIGTTAASMAIAIGFCAAWQGTRTFRFAERLLSPLLAVPHVAFAFGFAFLIAPSGWMLRLFSPWATGLMRPPDWLTVQDPGGISLILGLIGKEVPFLMVMILASLGQADAGRSRTIALTLGYGPITGWLKTILPRVYPQVRLPVLAVLAYSISVVDVAIILGPTTPAPLAVRLVRLFNDPELALRFVASAGACLQCAVVFLGILIWFGLERVITTWGTHWVTAGTRGQGDFPSRAVAAATFFLAALAVTVGLASMALWAFAASWRFPDLWPHPWTLANWSQHSAGLADPLAHTISVAVSVTLVALVLAIGILEYEARSGQRTWAGSIPFLYVPLVLPQIAFLFGAQILLVAAGLDGRWGTLAWIHFVFVFPYVFLSLADPYRAWDDRYRRTAYCLGASPWVVFFRIKLPMLLRPVATSAAVGFAVSADQYLPGILIGGGRYPTLTTEAVTLSSGGDYRVIGLFTLVQMSLPMLAYTTAALLPAWLFRHRSGMKTSQ